MTNGLLTGVDCVFVPVSDLDRAIEWYSAALGLRLRFKDEEHHAAGMGTDAGGICLVQVRNHRPIVFPDNDFAVDISFNYRTTDIDALHRSLANQGIETDAIEDSFDGMFRCFGFADPDGNRVSIVA
jgi:catechol 2,3-dioxygenase-like lactoylglutathione lyase family enzyme